MGTHGGVGRHGPWWALTGSVGRHGAWCVLTGAVGRHGPWWVLTERGCGQTQGLVGTHRPWWAPMGVWADTGPGGHSWGVWADTGPGGHPRGLWADTWPGGEPAPASPRCFTGWLSDTCPGTAGSAVWLLPLVPDLRALAEEEHLSSPFPGSFPVIIGSRVRGGEGTWKLRLQVEKNQNDAQGS